MAEHQLNQMQDDIAVLRDAHARQATTADSGAASALTLTVAAPGAGKRLHLTSLIAAFSDAGSNELTITLTQGGTRTIKVNTGSQLVMTGLDLVGDENTAITIDAPAGAAGVTSHVAAETWTETL